MNWREEWAKSLLTLGNFALLGLVFNGILNLNTRARHVGLGFVAYGICLWASWWVGRRRGGRDDG